MALDHGSCAQRENHLAAILERYAGVLLDAYGVLMHSQGALPGAAALIAELNRSGKPYFILTNDASRLPRTIADRFQRFGLDIAPERVITSAALLTRYFATHALAGARCAVLGTEDSREYVREAGGTLVGAETAFDALIVCDDDGYPFLETVNAALSTLYRLFDAGRAPQLLVPNPDLIFPMGDGGFGITSGSIALMFEAALQLRYPHRPERRFVRLGKPHAALFEEAVRRSGTRDLVMIGDQLETDIRGARAFGLDSVLVQTGVNPGSLAEVPEEMHPTYVLEGLAL
jgi:HAD superfamily hydrolase (TIGR01450 family)